MAYLRSKTLFFTTSPRTPIKMIPEIRLLSEKFTGQVWNPETQSEFMQNVYDDPSFEGIGKSKDLALSARDRITRAPKALGFVNLKPTIQLSAAGEALVGEKRVEETILRQLLKFQFPSPYHKEAASTSASFWVKPYLEMLRLVYTLEKVSFDELLIFGMQLIDYRNFEHIVSEIKKFRKSRKGFHGSYKQYAGETLDSELQAIFVDEISSGNTATRESTDRSIKNFLKTKRRNLRDYADACFRYLRATGLVEISHKGRSLSIMPDKRSEVKFILDTIVRDPVYVDDEKQYKALLFDASLPVLHTDDVKYLKDYIVMHSALTEAKLDGLSIEELKDVRDEVISIKQAVILDKQVEELKAQSLYPEIVETFNDILSDVIYDRPLMLEWNTWRAMTMIDNGNISGNFKVDDAGQPMSTASGNTADIVCEYDDFGLTVEVTMSSGQRQYESENEPVARHLAKFKSALGKDSFCLFIAPAINDASIAHFFMLAKTEISFYGGKSVIVPMTLEVFIRMVENSHSVDFLPTSNHVKQIFDYARATAESAADEKEWYSQIQEKAKTWLIV